MPNAQSELGDAKAPASLCKYVSRHVGELILKNRTLRWSTPGTLNDPYDMQFDLRLDIDKDAVKATALGKLWTAFYGSEPLQVGNRFGAAIKLLRAQIPQIDKEEFNQHFGKAIDESFAVMDAKLPDLQKDLRDHLASCKVLCLTGAPDKLLMWYRYAEEGRGLVLKFKDASGIDSPWNGARRVNYHTNMPLLVDNDYLADMLSGRASMDAQSIMHHMVYSKSLEWAYEAEWRIFTGQGRDPEAKFEDVHFNSKELDAVIFGHRMSDVDRHAIAEITRSQYPHAQLLQLRKSALIFFNLQIVPF
jgi:hypothetical protein